MALNTTPWDTAEHLRTPELIAAYVNAVLEDGDSTELAKALNTVARARRMHGIGQPPSSDRAAASIAAGDLDPVLRSFSDLGFRLQVAAA